MKNLFQVFAITYLIVFTLLFSASGQTQPKSELYAPIYSIYYPTGKWDLTTNNIDFLNSYVIQKIKIKDPPDLIIYLEGHTDDVGDSIVNLELSQKRVQAVADYLISNGFRADQIHITFYGESKPEERNIAISNNSEDIRYANRRVTIRIEKLL